MSAASWWAVVVFAVASLTDPLDGYLARRQGIVTKLGQFLDPLADKMLVGAAMIALVALREFPLWAALVIAVREVLVSVFRSFALRKGRSLPALLSGKIKTLVQIPMVIIWLFPREGTVARLQDAVLYVAVALTIFSGLQFLVRSQQGPAEASA